MIRIATGLIGFVYGLLFVWFVLFILSNVNFYWGQHNRVIQGCHEFGKCPMPWWVLPGLVAYIFTPPLLFAILNATAWKRWKLSKWGTIFCLLHIFIIIVYYILSGP